MKRMFTKAEILALVSAFITPLLGSSLKQGDYIINASTGKYEWVEDVPEDYTGANFFIDDLRIGIFNYVDGEEVDNITLDIINGVNKLNFAQLTHSFNELDPTLKALCESAVNNEVACTQEQWNVIKALLDKSLYFNYNGVNMIKSLFDGIENYSFGSMGGGDTGFKISFHFISDLSLLSIFYEEI